MSNTIENSTLTAETLYPQLARPRVDPTRFSEVRKAESVTDDALQLVNEVTESTSEEGIPIVEIIEIPQNDIASHEITGISVTWGIIWLPIIFVGVLLCGKLIKTLFVGTFTDKDDTETD